MHTNIHVHLFSADHTPPAQLYYMLRGALHSAARGLLPKLLGRPITSDDLRRFDRSMDRFDWPWPVLFQLASAAGDTFSMVDVSRLITMFRTVSRASQSDLRAALRVDDRETQADLLKGLLARTAEHRRAGRPLPFRDALCDVVKELYDAHEAKASIYGRVTQEELWDKFKNSPGADQYQRVIALSVNFDEAFLDDNLPGLSSFAAIEFADQIAELEQLAAKNNRGSGPRLLPFLGVDPRGHNARTLSEFVRSKVGKTKPFKGLKLYPPMGLLPTDDRLRPVFDYCQDEGVPVLSHCTVGGAGVRGSSRTFADLAHPLKWEDVLNRLERRAREQSTKMFRLCLAHFDRLEDPDDVSWCDELMGLMRRFDGSGKVEVYSDIAFDVVTGSSRKRYGDNVARVLDHGLGDRVLFGSDWWNYLYECDDESAFVSQLDVDRGWWKSADFDTAADKFLQDV